jgi:hypothetical protein
MPEERIVKIRLHSYRVGERVVSAKRGETIEVSKEESKRGDTLGAFYTDEELEAQESAEESEVEETPLTERSVEELISWIKDASPTEDELIAAADGDPDVAKRLLEAEGAATGGDPREGVVEGLAQVVANADDGSQSEKSTKKK